MYADIFEQVTGARFEFLPARAHRWRRHGLMNRTYPGAMPCKHEASSIKGVVWLDVSPAALAALDQFEGSEYRRIEIDVMTAHEQVLTAHIYQWLLPDQVEGQWDPITFERRHRRDFARIHGANRD